MKGKVYLVGAGPGDEGLITKKGYDLLKKADLIVYDRLVNKDLLDLAKKDCEFIYVGKTAKHHTKTQDEINEILYQEASKGKFVVRLKGGDPYVFGRGGEEGEYLYDRGIYFEEVPGVTSAIGGLAYAGIPITHRGVATSFHVITGHLQDGSDDLNWEALAGLKGTLVFLMGVGNLKNISDRLIENGKDPKTKAALVNWGTTTRQRVVEGELENIYDIAMEAGIKPPSLIVVGDVVGLREKLSFHERKPLFGENIVVTREKRAAGSTLAKFKELGANVISLPTIRTEPLEDLSQLDERISQLSSYDYLAFTSVNGVRIFMERLRSLGLDARALAGLTIAAIGPKTGQALEEYGIVPDMIPDKYAAEDLIDIMSKKLEKDDRVLVPRGELGRAKLIDELDKVSQVDELVIYQTLAEDGIGEDLDEIRELDSYHLLFTSSSSFKNFQKALGEENLDLLERGKIVSIGPITSQTIKEAGYQVYLEAEDYTIDGVIDVLMEEKIDE